MNEASIMYRQYQDSDYLSCESLVNNAWEFDRNFHPQELAALCKYLYTMGAVAVSNFSVVAENRDQVIGFIFGYNEKEPLPKHELQKLSKRLKILIQILFMKGKKFKEKIDFLNALGTHDKNKTALVKRGKSEITLFVVHPSYQGKGVGKRLFQEFRVYCEKSNVDSIIVETNKLGAASFYERIGFKLKGDFDSPLHEYVTKNGQACLYEYLCQFER